MSDHYLLTLYTDMSVDDAGNLVGPGEIVSISLNAALLAEGAEPMLPAGRYEEPYNSNSFLPETFNEGYLTSIDLPDGRVERPTNSFYGKLAEGETTFDPDLLREGYCDVQLNDDGTYAIKGILVGTKFLKRYVFYTGELTVIDRSVGGDPKIPNTTLGGDFALPAFAQAYLRDDRDTFWLQDESYRQFTLVLTESAAAGAQPSEEGAALRVVFFVEWTDDANDGIPEGLYRVTELTETGGIDRENIRPGNIRPGTPDTFTSPTGSWYRKTENGQLTEYARIDGGTMKVERGADGSHTLTIDFTDCDGHRVRGSYAQTQPITIF